MNEMFKNLLVNLKELGGAKREEVEAQLSKNADEVMHTGLTAGGKELIPTEVMGKSLLDLIPNYSYLLPLLPGSHGTGLELKEVLPIVGEANMYQGNSEWTTGGATPNDPTGKKATTGMVTIEQGQFILEIAVSKRELAYSVENLEALLRERMARSMARTVDAVILNGDSATSGNVNLDGSTPTSTLYYLQSATGLRKVGIANSIDVGTFDEDDIIDALDKIGDYASDPASCLLAVNRKLYNKMLKFTNLKTYDKNSTNATIQTGVLANIFGVDVLVHRDMPALAKASGKVGDGETGNENTYGQFLVFNKNAVQFGFGKIDDFEITKVAGKGVMLTSTFEFGCTVLNGEAGLDKMVASGVKVTMS